MKKIRFYVLLSMLFIISCQPKLNSRGNPMISDKFNDFVVGKTTADEVLKKCGSPSLHKDESTWIYVSGTSEEIAFKELAIKNKCIVRLKFNVNGVLESINKIDQRESLDIFLDEEITGLSSDKQIEQQIKDLIK